MSTHSAITKTMIDLPDLADYGYQINTELGRNREGGRITWKGLDLAHQQIVVIKQFCFATIGSTWSGYQAYQQEIEILQKLNHPGIPRYLDSFETESGFCLIQEYKSAFKLSDFRELTLVEIKKVIIQLLEILIYLHTQKPPILHRDIKPENILIDDALNVYLIDFGFASLGSKKASVSSISKGTPGFMAPEQVIQPTAASDLYSLGVTTVCLLTHKNSSEIRELSIRDHPYELKFKSYLPELNRQFVDWLSKMVQPQLSKRFSSAAAAKAALESIDLNPKEAIVPSNFKPIGEIALSINKTFALGTSAITVLSTTAVLALNFAAMRMEKNTISIAVAILTAIVVTITEVGSLTLAISEEHSTKLPLVLGVTIPLLLVGVSSFFFGMSEGIASSAGITIGEIFCLAYFLKQKSPFTAISLFAASGLGIALGLVLIS